MAMKRFEGRYPVASGGVLVLAPSRRPWSLRVELSGAGSYTVEISASPADAINPDSGSGGMWEQLEAGAASDLIPCDYAVSAIRVTLTGTAGVVELAT